MHERDAASAPAWLEEWRELERALAVIPPDDPGRRRLEEQRDRARRRYHELFAATAASPARRDPHRPEG